jgi:hypothetical protein
VEEFKNYIMLSIENTQIDVYFIVYSNDKTIIHNGFLEVGSSMSSGQDILETFDTEEEMQTRLNFLNGL